MREKSWPLAQLPPRLIQYTATTPIATTTLKNAHREKEQGYNIAIGHMLICI